LNWHKIFENETQAKAAIGLMKSRVFSFDNQDIVIFRTKSGLWALENKCPHQSLPLKGSSYIGGDKIECPFHFLTINLRTGITGNNTYQAVKTYPIQVRNDGIFVEL
jgi:nitrite reductase/ring-hydroxylating ferredoxin subunit